MLFIIVAKHFSRKNFATIWGNFSLLDLNYTGFYLCSLFILMLSGRELGIQIKQVTSFYFKGILCSAEFNLEIRWFWKENKFIKIVQKKLNVWWKSWRWSTLNFLVYIVLFSWDSLCLLCISTNKRKTLSLKLVG